MKVLTVIIHTNIQQHLSDLLRTLQPVSGFTFTHVEGHGVEVEKDSFTSAHDVAVGYIPRIRTDILLNDEDVDTVLAALRSKEIGLIGQSFYWVSDADKGGQL